MDPWTLQAGGGDGRPSGARGGGVEDDPYDSNTSSLAQLVSERPRLGQGHILLGRSLT